MTGKGGGSERKSATFRSRVSEGENATLPRKKERERERDGEGGKTERGREKEQSDRGSLLPAGLADDDEGGLVARLLVRSMSSLSSSLSPSIFFSLSLTLIPVPSTVPSRSPPTSSTPVLHRAHETRVPVKSLCHLANERPSAARIIPRRARSRKISWSRPRRVVIVVIVGTLVAVGGGGSGELRHRGSPVTLFGWRRKENAVRSEMCTAV